MAKALTPALKKPASSSSDSDSDDKTAKHRRLATLILTIKLPNFCFTCSFVCYLTVPILLKYVRNQLISKMDKFLGLFKNINFHLMRTIKNYTMRFLRLQTNLLLSNRQIIIWKVFYCSSNLMLIFWSFICFGRWVAGNLIAQRLGCISNIDGWLFGLHCHIIRAATVIHADMVCERFSFDVGSTNSVVQWSVRLGCISNIDVWLFGLHCHIIRAATVIHADMVCEWFSFHVGSTNSVVQWSLICFGRWVAGNLIAQRLGCISNIDGWLFGLHCHIIRTATVIHADMVCEWFSFHVGSTNSVVQWSFVMS
uniref:Transmembrane protein n=1 Tax=Heterorhabditis bacteriophora TaxID=37862 RepID=A0A1I7XC20_HETBA